MKMLLPISAALARLDRNFGFRVLGLQAFERSCVVAISRVIRTLNEVLAGYE